MNLYTWDELSNCVMEWKTVADFHDLWLQNREFGWETDGWFPHSEVKDIRIIKTDKHWGLETWADSIQDAEAKFALTQLWKDYNEEQGE